MHRADSAHQPRSGPVLLLLCAQLFSLLSTPIPSCSCR